MNNNKNTTSYKQRRTKYMGDMIPKERNAMRLRGLKEE
jgi:hypothetical protein